MNKLDSEHLITRAASLRLQSILALHTNKLIGMHERIERLALPPAVLHTHIVLRLPPAGLTLAQPAILAKVNDAWDSSQPGAKAAASIASFLDLRTAAAHVGKWFLLIEGFPGDVADVPDFEDVVPDGVYCCSAGNAGAEGEQGDNDRFELHGCCC